MLAIVAIVVGITAAAAAGGKLWRLSAVSLRFELVLLALFVVQGAARGRLFGLAESHHLGLLVWVAVTILIMVILAANVGQPGIAIVLAGLAANLDVVLLNGSMPVSPDAIARISASSSSTATALDVGFYRLQGAATLLPWLGDIMPVRLYGPALILSLGDVLLACGVAVFVFAACMDDQSGETG